MKPDEIVQKFVTALREETVVRAVGGVTTLYIPVSYENGHYIGITVEERDNGELILSDRGDITSMTFVMNVASVCDEDIKRHVEDVGKHTDGKVYFDSGIIYMKSTADELGRDILFFIGILMTLQSIVLMEWYEKHGKFVNKLQKGEEIDREELTDAEQKFVDQMEEAMKEK